MTSRTDISGNNRSARRTDGRQGGFTIIEVLIVLAIAALIMIIVLLAVPALERSQRNQSRKTDAKALAAALSAFAGTNGAQPPAGQGDIDTVTGNTKLAYYKPANIFYGSSPNSSVSGVTTLPAADTNSTEELNVYVGDVCSGPDGPATASGANSRTIAIVYVLEQAHGNGQLQCLGN